MTTSRQPKHTKKENEQFKRIAQFYGRHPDGETAEHWAEVEAIALEFDKDAEDTLINMEDARTRLTDGDTTIESKVRGYEKHIVPAVILKLPRHGRLAKTYQMSVCLQILAGDKPIYWSAGVLADQLGIPGKKEEREKTARSYINYLHRLHLFELAKEAVAHKDSREWYVVGVKQTSTTNGNTPPVSAAISAVTREATAEEYRRAKDGEDIEPECPF